MNGDERRDKIFNILTASKTPTSASKIAAEFQVSRQIIVGDIALLRAAGKDIVATARGYLLEEAVANQMVSKIACQHAPSETQKELEIIVENGGEVLDVLVEHPLYGELSGRLDIASLEDVATFMKHYASSQTTLLSELTDGIHLHTIRYKEEKDLAQIKNALKTANILYENI